MSTPDATSATQPAMPLGTAAAVTIGIIVIIAGYIALGTALGLVPLYAGFLLLWYFGAIDLLEPGALPALAIGALCGTGTAFLLQQGLALYGPAGTLPVLALIVLALFCQLVGWLPIAINRAYMLYLTIMAAPLIQTHESFVPVFAAIVLATVYFGGLVLIVRRVTAARQQPA
jgi:hypothetical protein